MKTLRESIKELKQICRPNKKEDIEGRLIRNISIYFTWLLLHTPISANGVTILFGIVGMIGAFLFGLGSYWCNIAGAICLLLSTILDYSDGEVARYRKTCSWIGSFLELICHQLVHGSIFIGISWGVYYHYWSHPLVFGFGFSGLFFALMHRSFPQNKLWALNDVNSIVDDHVMNANIGEGKSIAALINRMFFCHLGFLSVVFITIIIERIDVVLYFYGLLLPPHFMLKLARVYMKNRSGKLLDERASIGKCDGEKEYSPKSAD